MWTTAEVISKGIVTKNGCDFTVQYSTDDLTPRTFMGSIHLGLGQDETTLQVAIDQQLADLNAHDAASAADQTRIDALQSVVDKVTLPLPPPPPPPPTADEIALAAFQARVTLVIKLSAAVDVTNPELIALKAQNIIDLQAHPEWKNFI